MTFQTTGDFEETKSVMGSSKQHGFETGVYIENEISVGGRFFTDIGLRFSNYRTSGRNYSSAEPRCLQASDLEAAHS